MSRAPKARLLVAQTHMLDGVLDSGRFSLQPWIGHRPHQRAPSPHAI